MGWIGAWSSGTLVWSDSYSQSHSRLKFVLIIQGTVSQKAHRLQICILVSSRWIWSQADKLFLTLSAQGRFSKYICRFPKYFRKGAAFEEGNRSAFYILTLHDLLLESMEILEILSCLEITFQLH